MDKEEKTTIDNSELSSEEETFVNVDEILKSSLKKIFQIQINENSLFIKHIGMGSDVPDIIIKEDFGKKSNLNLYNCIYTETDLIDKVDNTHFLPIMKLVEKSNDFNKIYSISVKLNQDIVLDNTIDNFDIYLTYMVTKDFFEHIKLDKDINSQNIIEKLFENIIEQGFAIL
jgi:hypothetical protein